MPATCLMMQRKTRAPRLYPYCRQRRHLRTAPIAKHDESART